MYKQCECVAIIAYNTAGNPQTSEAKWNQLLTGLFSAFPPRASMKISVFALKSFEKVDRWTSIRRRYYTYMVDMLFKNNRKETQ